VAIFGSPVGSTTAGLLLRLVVAGLRSIGAFPASGDKVSAQGLTAVLGIFAAGCAGARLLGSDQGLVAEVGSPVRSGGGSGGVVARALLRGSVD